MQRESQYHPGVPNPESTSPTGELDAVRAGQILLDILSFADAGKWRDPDPLLRPFAEIPVR